MSGAGSVPVVTTLAERLGYASDDRLLIINCDDLGSCHAANVGIYEALRDGVATSATLMVPCPWARDAAARYRGEDVGVHLTLNAEHERYRWGPITQAPSLLDGDGGFPRTVTDVWDHADLDEVRRELRAQVERAILWGFDVSHLDSHMGTVQLRPEFFDVYLDLAVDFGLPLRLSGASTERVVGFPFRRLAGEAGVLFPDSFVLVRGVGSARTIERARLLAPAGGHRGLRPPRRRCTRAAGPRPGLGGPRRRPRPRHERRRAAGVARRRRRAAHRLPRDPRPPARRVSRRRPLALLPLALLVAACVDPEPSTPDAADLQALDLSPDHTVTVDAAGFSPERLDIEPGDVVLLVNEGDEVHSFTADQQAFDTGRMEPGEETTLVLTDPGEVTYHDAEDPDRRGTIVVAAEG